MGYIGLLLNAPYKIDSMVWMMMGFGSFDCFYSDSFCLLFWLNESRMGF
jgi:hypothetical protein